MWNVCYEVVSVICSNIVSGKMRKNISTALHSTSHKMPFENISALNATTGNEIENLMRISEIDKSLNYFSRSFFHSPRLECLIWSRSLEIVSNAIRSHCHCCKLDFHEMDSTEIFI